MYPYTPMPPLEIMMCSGDDAESWNEMVPVRSVEVCEACKKCE